MGLQVEVVVAAVRVGIRSLRRKGCPQRQSCAHGGRGQQLRVVHLSISKSVSSPLTSTTKSGRARQTHGAQAVKDT